ncbi:MAG: hypothetical protein JNN32_09110 [Flavobacteriales bacterium]|nr:hypothetical protein [Flavobacteriales bacterium]
MRHRRIIAWVLLTIMVGDITWPTASFALTSGPTQPEVQSFKPVSASDMVDLFTGDFSYNIPLLDVEGYPVNLFYQGGITMDQEASWVGLGWNLNPGAVNRNLRGLPDDFNGDELRRDMHMRPNRSFGVTAGAGVDLASYPLGVGGTASMTFNNYNGVSFETGLSANLSLPIKGGSRTAFTAGLGLSSGSHSGLRMQPQIGIDAWKSKDGGKVSLGVGLTLDSRRGLTQVTLDASATSKSEFCHPTNSKYDSEKTQKVGVSSSFNIGMPTYTPQLDMSMDDLSLTFNLSNGVTIFTLDGNYRVGAFFSVQRLRDRTTRTPAYGYLYLQNAQDGGSVALDFNREKGGPYSPDQAALGISALTPDIFSVTGQGVSGSYRPFRNEVGHVFDPFTSSGGSGGSLGLELSAGNLIHGGADVKVNSVTSWSGRWNLFNQLLGRARFIQNGSSPLQENVTFRNASEPVVEADGHLFEAFGGADQYRPALERVGSSEATILARIENSQGNNYIPIGANNTRTAREHRAQVFHYLTHQEVANGMGLDEAVPHIGLTPRAAHLSEISILGQQGERYVYGLPVYNAVQEDVTFSVSEGVDATEQEELVGYSSTDDGFDNRSGIDQYYSRSTVPSYPHAWLLTAVVSSDYSDVDNVRGPSDGDLGTFTRFTYTQNTYGEGAGNAFYPWRTPIGAGGSQKARLERGLGATAQDDRGSYVYGEKEMRYLETIESANRIAVFELNDPTLEDDPQDPQGGRRLDGLGVGRNGEVLASRYQRYLTRISLYDKRSYQMYQAARAEAIANNQDPDDVPLPEVIKRVHFKYDYSLCPNTPNTVGGNKGKLTLRKVWFTYGRSEAGVLAPYVFDYGETNDPIQNPPYDMGDQDRWGQYKPDYDPLDPLSMAAILSQASGGFYFNTPNNFYPYTEQFDLAADAFAHAWKLRTVRLPSGALMGMEYESDDYAHVQNKPAMRMFKISHVAEVGETPTSIDGNSEVQTLKKKRVIYFRLPPEVTDPLPISERDAAANAYVREAARDIGLLYFRTRMIYRWASGGVPMGADHVSGYAELEPLDGNSVNFDEIGGIYYGRLPLKAVDIDENCSVCLEGTSPLYRAALEHARLNYPKQLYTPPGMDDELSASELIEWIPAQLSAITGFITGLSEFFMGPNAALVQGANIKLDGVNPLGMRMGHSWIKLREPDQRKKGGGYRVRTIGVYDGWGEMQGQAPSATYAQQYAYGDASRSWGVAAYEPMIGADENPFRRPIYNNIERVMSADERFFQEEPFGESLFPAPVVGYSKVEVKDVSNGGSTEQRGTGKVVHEFFTAFDFPTMTKRTSIHPVHHPSPGVSGLLGIKAMDHMHVSQGFVIENNDMHGKPRSVTVYAEPAEASQDAEQIISSVAYHYRRTSGGALDNRAMTIQPDGSISEQTIGRNYEFLFDMREYGSIASSTGAMVNLEIFMLGIIPITFPPIIPQYSYESTRFRSAVLVKQVDRFGLLEKIVKTDHGSVVSTENIAHDAITGKVLLTRSNNQYRDPVYSFEQPAYWYYDGMGPAYRNLGATARLTLNAQGVAVFPNARTVFVPGDEVSMRTVTIPPALPVWHKGWVTKVDDGSLRIVDRDGQPIVPAGDHFIKVIRSGRRNMQAVPMAAVTALKDPLYTLPANSVQKVLKATAVEFKDEWRKDCACSPSTDTGEGNPYADNRKGVWRQFRERTWLTDRVRTLVNDNTDIRHDGIYSSFDPFFKVNNGSWSIDPTGWTVVREVIDYSARSQALEEKDALGLYSSATFAHAGLLPNTVAANARHQEVGFESFESPANCADEHFRFDDGEGAIVDSRAHSGRHSIRVPNGQRARFVAVLRGCEEVECPVVQSYRLNAGMHEVTVTGGSPPYDASGTIVLAGNPTVGLIANGVGVTGTGTWSVKVVIRDAAGCERSMVVPPQQ